MSTSERASRRVKAVPSEFYGDEMGYIMTHLFTPKEGFLVFAKS